LKDTEYTRTLKSGGWQEDDPVNFLEEMSYWRMANIWERMRWRDIVKNDLKMLKLRDE
jgi:hypothetical protein